MFTYAAGVIRVLIVDDDPLFAEVATIILSAEASLEVVGHGHNGLEGVELAQSLAPDVVLMDLNMPVLDGFEAIRRLRALRPSTSIVVVTGSNSPLDVDRARCAGAAAYLTKERIGDDLVVAVREAARPSSPPTDVARPRYQDHLRSLPMMSPAASL